MKARELITSKTYRLNYFIDCQEKLVSDSELNVSDPHKKRTLNQIDNICNSVRVKP